ncbi:MAG: hypothetical protein R2747_24050 [Pyrinomonadaceae bacterium]
MTKIIFILQMISTLWMAGLIWTIQLVHYPFFSQVRAENFASFHASHTFWMGPLAVPAMIIELVTSVLLILFPPEMIDPVWLWAGLILTLVTWFSTAFWQIPLHRRLSGGFDSAAQLRLVNTNWIRTAAWSLRAGLVIFWAWKVIGI